MNSWNNLSSRLHKLSRLCVPSHFILYHASFIEIYAIYDQNEDEISI